MSLRVHSNRDRSSRGQALTGLIAFVGLFVIGALGMLAFEISRYALVKSQLKNCTDAAALTASSTLAMYSATQSSANGSQTSYTDPLVATRAQTSAVNTALKLFRQNSILGQPLTQAAQVSPSAANPAPGQAQISIEFLTPETNPPQVVPIGNPDGKIVRVTATYGVFPIFGPFLPISAVPARDVSVSAVPMLDVVDCFDIGGSADDQTLVTFIKRVWVGSANSGQVEYLPVTGTTGVAEGPIAKILNEPARGINVNALEPQGLENADTAPAPLKFSETQQATMNLRGVTNSASPPGNYPGQGGASNHPSTGGADTFTDLVVNLDGNTHFNGATTNGYAFPNIAVVVEAARGNLESDAAFTAAHLNGNPNFNGISPHSGYQMAYEAAAQALLQPLNTARNESLNFSYSLLHTNNARIGEVSFNDIVGSFDLSTFPAQNVSAAYAAGGNGTFLLPNAYERPINDPLFAQYKALCTSPPARNYGFTNNSGAAIRAAIGWLTNPTYHRPNADRAIVIFTNSAPSASEMPATRAAAAQAKSLGIPIYVVGLAQSNATASAQMSAYSDSQSNPSSGGVCGIASHGGRFFQITNPTNLPQGFGNVARQLVKLTPTI